VLKRKSTNTQYQSKLASMFRGGCRLRYWLSLSALLIAETAAAQQSLLNEPFTVRNQNPFMVVHGLPAAASADLLPVGESSLQLQYDITNHSKSSETADESITLDGETYRATLVYRRGLAGGWQMGVELPLIAHTSGVMDHFIEAWHDTFGLSNSDRKPWPKNRLRFSYTHQGVLKAEMTAGDSGPGDMRLLFSRRLTPPQEERQLAFNASLKFPTGDADRFQGSGSLDLALWLSGAAPNLSDAWHLGGYLHGGILLLGRGDLLREEQKGSVWFGGAGLHWRAWEWLTLKAQLDGHSAFYQSELDQLGKGSVMLTLGGSIPVRRGAIDLAIGENLATDAVPDFMINLGYRIRF